MHSPKAGKADNCGGIGFSCFVALTVLFSILPPPPPKQSHYCGEAEKFHHVHDGKTKMDNYGGKSLSLVFEEFV